MRIRILAAGKPSLAYAKLAVDDYGRRLARSGAVEIAFVKAGATAAASRDLLERSAGGYRVVVDERGEQLTTLELAARIGALELRGDVKALVFLVGAADGHSEELRRKADMVLALSRLTMQHELALVVLLEQLYRVAELRRGGPYHRD